MNLSSAIFLVNKTVRAVRVVYDPDNYKNNDATRRFKTLDPDLKKDDFVIVPTNTRHGFTIAKVEEIGFRPDFHSQEQYFWIAGKLDKDAYDLMLAQEKIVVDRIGDAEENRIREELKKSMGLGDIDFTDLDVVKGSVLPAIASPRGTAQPVQAQVIEAAEFVEKAPRARPNGDDEIPL